MKTFTRLAGPAIGILSGLALIAAPIANAIDADSDFLATLSLQGITWDSSATVIKYGHDVCGDWAAGDSFEQVLNDASNLGLSADDTGYFVGAATGAYCPQYASQIPS